MGKIVVSEFVSLDGVMEDPGGAEGFKHGGWTFAFDRGADGDKFKLDEVLAAEGLLLGRKTYEGFAAAWPTMQGPFAEKFNAMPKYVVSTTLGEPSWTNTTVVGGDVAVDVARVRADVDGELLVNGSAQLVQALVELELVDELRLMVFPVILGCGTRLLGTTSEKKTMHLLDSRSLGEGVALLTYAPA